MFPFCRWVLKALFIRNIRKYPTSCFPITTTSCLGDSHHEMRSPVGNNPDTMFISSVTYTYVATLSIFRSIHISRFPVGTPPCLGDLHHEMRSPVGNNTDMMHIEELSIDAAFVDPRSQQPVPRG